MTKKPNSKRKKPGPEAERLIIEEDPKKALDKLFKPPPPKPEPPRRD